MIRNWKKKEQELIEIESKKEDADSKVLEGDHLPKIWKLLYFHGLNTKETTS